MPFTAGSPHTDPNVTISVVSPNHPDAEQLVGALFVEQLARYGFADPPEAEPHEFTPPNGIFLIAYLDQQPIACGGYRTHQPGVAEIKKMYVRPEHRGRHLGKLILAELEAAARRCAATQAILETGALNTEALALYTHAGYTPIPAYRDRDTSVNRAMTKTLS